jgi:hypothetical protein
MTGRNLAAIGASAVLLAVARPLPAQVEPAGRGAAGRGAAGRGDRSPAVEQADAGHDAFAEGDYDLAIERFTAAHALDKDPRTLYNLGLCYLKRYERDRNRDDLILAKDRLRAFLSAGPSGGTDRERRLVDQARAFAESHLTRIEAELSRSAPAPSAPRRDDRSLDLLGNRPARSTDRSLPRASIVLYVTAGALAVGAGVTGALAWRTDRDSDHFGDVGELEAANDRADRADALALVTDGLALAAATSAIVGLVVQLTSEPSSPAIMAGPRSISLLFTY